MKKENKIENEPLAIIPLEYGEALVKGMTKAKIDFGLSPSQAFMIIQPTDPKIVKQRVVAKTKTGREIRAKYVSGKIFELKLISVFGWNWRTEIIKSETKERKDGKREFVKTMRLSYKLQNGDWNFVERTGGAVSKEGIDDFLREKAAETDAFKRCCLAIGFFSDVYSSWLEMTEDNPKVKNY